MNVKGYEIHDGNIGSGSYGLVKKCTKDGKIFAVKIMEGDTPFGITDLLELSIMKSFNHPNVNSAIDIHIENNKIYIFQDIAQQDLRRFIRVEDITDKKKILFDIVKGLYFLHINGIIHGDIKPSNILCYGDSYKITDFGQCSKKWYKSICYSHETGTPPYKSPEILSAKKWSFESDVWSLGCIFYEVYACKKLFNNHKVLESNLYKTAHRDFNNFMYNNHYTMTNKDNYVAPNINRAFISKRGDNFMNLFRSMMQIDRKDRISCDKIIKHPYFYRFTFTLQRSNKFNLTCPHISEIIPYIPKVKEFSKITKCLLIRTMKLYSYCRNLNIPIDKKVMTCYIISYKLIKGDDELPESLKLDVNLEKLICEYIDFKFLCL